MLVVEVTAHQFYWEYEYPGGALSFDTLYLPVDRPVTLVIRSADVDHSWWVPELTGKRDAIPGRTNELNFTPRADRHVSTTASAASSAASSTRRCARSSRWSSADDFEIWLADNAPAR